MPIQKKPDTNWDDSELISLKMSPDTKFLFEKMNAETIGAVNAKPEEEILDIACGRSIDAFNIACKGAVVYGLEPSSKMLRSSLEWIKPGTELPVILVRALAEDIPFSANSFDKLLCKGAIDHFADLERSLKEAFRVLKPGGKFVISVANFSSLGCRLSKLYDKVFKKIVSHKKNEHPFYEPPLDHNYKFDYNFLVKSIRPYFELESISGLSLLWGTPGWGALLEKLPESLQNKILNFLDWLAKRIVPLSDVLIAIATPRKQIPNPTQDSSQPQSILHLSDSRSI